ncbi:MAG: RsmB/NOP family class I SAM-dependent RNA methyltransferase [Armatimonadota bacterium]|nr:RsmB/NOP family class I SAM-dependent RNA methyltransferase [Armatimonadota bacterium]MDW8156387.1 RsmB/NOP family class I SAM-dependent RNA methyltransferase [Armatimonadota bacterium]
MPWPRYRGVLPEWEACEAACGRPAPKTVRTFPSRLPDEVVVRRLSAQGFVLEPLPFPPHVYRLVREPFPVGKTLEHWLGYVYVQESVMALVAHAVVERAEPKVVLDLCAAPGGKTTHLSELLPGATVVAADTSQRRLRALGSNLQRTARLNVATFRADGRTFPLGAPFDAVLVDAPCSAEGNVRDDPRVLRDLPEATRRRLSRLQEALLRRAVRLVRPGGVVVYATCTFAPEENEAVVDRVLCDHPELAVELLRFPVPHADGLVEFSGQPFHPQLRQAWRVYPHHMDSGGLFLVRLRRAGGGGSEAAADVPPLVHPAARLSEAEASRRVDRAVRLLTDELGVAPVHLQKLRWMVASRHLWLHRCEVWPASRWKPSRAWELTGCGLRAFARWGRGEERPTSWLVQWLGDRVRNRVELEPEQWDRLLCGQAVPTSAPSGFVALSLRGEVLGAGLVRAGRVRHLIPADRAASLREALHLTGAR